MKNTKHNPTMMIKSAFSNKIHKLMDKCYGIKKHTKEWYDCKRQHYDYTGKPKLTDKEKIELFDKIEEIYRESSNELVSYYQDRNFKKKVIKKRLETGYTPKKKTTKEEYLKMVESVEKVS
jgi:uncharacterized protein YukJ